MKDVVECLYTLPTISMASKGYPRSFIMASNLE